MLMSPEFEAAAKELEGKVRFAKIDTDKEEAIATRLAINGLPTLLFFDRYGPKYVGQTKTDGDGDENRREEMEAKGVLAARIEGALRKEQITGLCDHYFFDGPEPKF